MPLLQRGRDWSLKPKARDHRGRPRRAGSCRRREPHRAGVLVRGSALRSSLQFTTPASCTAYKNDVQARRLFSLSPPPSTIVESVQSMEIMLIGDFNMHSLGKTTPA
ncbi:hypothetical protein NDU88_007226 [Pleurodeles waltl]|uniref:Endonuclease/exonuclease/phosphatase domain-containing protein n=1 Tax=Pleurodeles waltl TaxID=8319 RepID=A0AAV7RTG1_PLEWA|nr:hypothetical protein NDU88_007226 [Pleurodeles waltl]